MFPLSLITAEILNNRLLQLIKIDYGMKEKNPIDFLQFYTKNNEKEATKLPEGKVGSAL